ncbi:hemin uptake protein HemP [Luteimonas sp. 8-5]|uniref:hemin uptake protein HemP n=1 Tax=Luteimonas sp. 8-5 TaxID=3039387 RepID=UPI0031BB60A2
MQASHAVSPLGRQARDAKNPAAMPEIDSRELLKARNEVLIRHAGECYRLRLTRNDKLILTK